MRGERVGAGEYVVDLPDSYCSTANRQVSVTLTSDAISGGYVLSETISTLYQHVVLGNVPHGGTSATLSLGPVTVTAGDGTPNIRLTGSGNADGIAWTRSGSGDPLDSDIVDQLQDGLATSTALQVVDNNVDQIATDTTTLLGRVTSTVVTLWANLTAMITGSGLSAKFTTTALENAPGGGAGGEGDASQSTLLAVKQKTDLIGTTTFVAASFAPDSGNAIRIKVGDSPTITFTSSVENAVPDLTEATIRFGVRQHPSGEQLLTVNTGEVIVATGLQSVRVPLLVADTLLLQDASDCFEYRYDVEARYGDGSVRTMQSGAAMIEHDYSGV